MRKFMLVLLVITMIIIFIITALVYDFDVMEPATLVIGTMMFSCIMALTQESNWGLTMSFTGYVGLVLAMLSFLSASIWCSQNNCIKYERSKAPKIITRDSAFFFSLVLMAVLAFFSIQEVYQASVFLGNTQGIFFAIKILRPAIEAQEFSFSRWMYYRMMIAQVITYVYVYVFFYNCINKKFKWNQLVYLLPTIFYVPFMISTTGRMSLVMYIIYSVVIGMLLYHKKNGYGIKVNKKVFLILAISGLIFFIFFLIMGNLTGKIVSEQRTPLVILAHYAGLSIPAFDSMVNKAFLDSGYIGANTLLGLYRVLSHFGLQAPSVDIFLPFVQFNGINTNVYTAEWRYVLDYGFVGMTIIMAILGIAYTFFYEYVNSDKSSPFMMMFYAMMAYPLFLSSIDERFMLDLLGTTAIYNFTLLYIVSKVLIKKTEFD